VGDTAVIARHRLRYAVNIDDAYAEAQFNPVLLIPIESIHNDVVQRLFARQYRGKKNAVVIDVCFVAENRDIELLPEFQDLFDARDPRHTVPDNNKFLHQRTSPVRLPRSAGIRYGPSIRPCSFPHERNIACNSAPWKLGQRRFASPGWRSSPRNE